MIILVDQNKELIKRAKEVIGDCSFITAEHGDIFKIAPKYNAKIATASNPQFDMAGGLDAQIAKRFPEEIKQAKEFMWSDNLFFTISVNGSTIANKAIILRAMAGIFAYHNRFNIAVTGLGTGIGGLDVEDFIEVFADLSEADLSEANLSRADLGWADLSEANLSGADLSEANLSRANLSRAGLGWADLSEANLSGADLSEANLSRANLSRAGLGWANLSEANLSRANLSGADLGWADLSEANLSRADLSRANHTDTAKFNEATAFWSLQCPEVGDFVGWKKCRDNVIVKLLVPARAKRSSATTRKCRASYVKVLEVFGGVEGASLHDDSVIYKKGKTVKCDKWEEDRWVECGGGIHFFITRAEAEIWSI